MAWILLGFDVTCTGCGFGQGDYEFPFDYRYMGEVGNEPIVIQRVSWCQSCRRVVPAEQLPTPAQVEAYIRDLADSPDAESTARELRTTCGALRGRSNPPRCLDCGSASIIYFDEELLREARDYEIEHPACRFGGKLRFEIIGVGVDDTKLFVSPEGERVG